MRQAFALFVLFGVLASVPVSAKDKPVEVAGISTEAAIRAIVQTAAKEGWTVDTTDPTSGIVTLRAGAYNVTVIVEAAGTGVALTITKKQSRLAFRAVRGVEKKIVGGVTAAAAAPKKVE